MEAPLPLHQLPIPPPLPQDVLLQQAVAAGALMMAAAGNKEPPTATGAGPGREQCPRCASRDTKFCYYNNYNTAQPRHFCRACRRYWTLGGSLRNVPVGGSTRKRPRPCPARRPTRTMAAAAVAAAMATLSTTTRTASAGGSPFATSPAPLLQSAAGGEGLLLSSLLLGSASASASPLLALGAVPLLEGRLGFDLGLGDAALGATGGGPAAGDLAYHNQQPLGAGPLPWPTSTATILEGDRAEMTTTWKTASSLFPFAPAAALWQELSAAAPVLEAGGLHHGGAPHLLL